MAGIGTTSGAVSVAATLILLLTVGPIASLIGILLGELVILYLGAGGIGLLFERRAGQIAPQGWEFYAVTGALFLVLAFPGFTWRYLLKHRK